MTMKNDTKLKKNWLVLLKLTWKVSQIWPRALESVNNLCFNWLLVTKVCNFWATKAQRSYLYDTEEWCEIWWKTELWFEKWHEKSGSFLPEHLKVSKLGLWWDPLVQSRKGMTLKFEEKLYVMTMNNNAKFEKELTCHFKTDMRNLTNFDSSTRKSKKIAL